jgi:hypothetical protein
MTPKEKAKELVEKFDSTLTYLESKTKAKQCALIAVDLRLDGDFIFNSIEYGIDSLEYWQEVKQEIEKI